MARILIVDDEHKIGRLLTDELRDAGHDAASTTRPEDALESIRRDPPDILITDLRMGAEGYYAFQFKVGEIGNPHSVPLPSERLESTLDDAALTELWRRLKGD